MHVVVVLLISHMYPIDSFCNKYSYLFGIQKKKELLPLWVVLPCLSTYVLGFHLMIETDDLYFQAICRDRLRWRCGYSFGCSMSGVWVAIKWSKGLIKPVGGPWRPDPGGWMSTATGSRRAPLQVAARRHGGTGRSDTVPPSVVGDLEFY